eukprot:342870_1
MGCLQNSTDNNDLFNDTNLSTIRESERTAFASPVSVRSAATIKRDEKKKTLALLIDLYLTQLKRKCMSFKHWDVPKEIVAICILYCEVTDGSLIMKPNSFIQLNANYEYVFEDVQIGESCTLSARQNDDNKAKITIHCFGNIKMSSYSYIHLNDTLKLSSHIGYAIYIESFGDIIMDKHSHIEIDSNDASIFIKCNKLIMSEGASINAENGREIVLVITDDKNRKTLEKDCISPRPVIHKESPADALANINAV